jgi:uncharacterized membrane protein
VAPRTLALWRGIGALALLIAWVTVSHLRDAAPNATGLGLLLGLGPLFMVALLVAWRAKWRLPALLLWGVAVALACRYRDLLGAHLGLIDLAQDLAAYGALAFAFARSLAPDRTPLCTQWATVQHGPLPPPALVYTRRVTGAWALLFAGITVLLVAVFVLASPRVWSLFSDFGAFALIAAMFVGEYLVRGRALPELAKGGILESLRAYARAQAPPPRA